ncbi:MAG: MFS transporter [Rhodospirillaceae bacterium]|jgi:predicted MFS family arabinose efflux permease
MDNSPTTKINWRKPVLVLVCGTLILLLSVGIRQTFGLFMAPISSGQGWGREVFALAIATQNLAWGLTQPFTGALADKFGPGKVIALSGALYVGGLYMMSGVQTPAEILISNGFMIGFALSGCGYPVVLAAISRNVPEKWRSLFLGIGSTGGSSGQLLMIPMSQYFISVYDWMTALLIMACMAGLIVPMAAAMAGRKKSEGTQSSVPQIDQTIKDALEEARGHSGYILLTTGFFVCGWQIGFVSAHFPAYLSDHGFSPAIAAAALALIGLSNIFGTLISGALGGRFRKKTLLAGLYFLRAVVFAAFLIFPMTETGILVFAVALGLLWLATVPLTSGLVGQMFGIQYMAMLYGITFMSHQIGSFCGVWLGGFLFDTTGSYDVIWWGSIILGLVATFMHVLIDDRTVPRLSGVSANETS